MQESGHEIGWHNDLVTTECVHGVDARALLSRELVRLRNAGLSIEGVAAHGAPSCYRYGYRNGYFFFPDEADARFPNVDTVDGPLGKRRVPRGTLAEYGFTYDAYHLDNTTYFSDASFSSEGRRWHTDDLDLGSLGPGSRTIILTHPDHWDRSMPAKLDALSRQDPIGDRRRWLTAGVASGSAWSFTVRIPSAKTRVLREARAAQAHGYDVDVSRSAGRASHVTRSSTTVASSGFPVTMHRRTTLQVPLEYVGFLLLATLWLLRSLIRPYDVVQVHNPPDFLVAAATIRRGSAERASSSTSTISLRSSSSSTSDERRLSSERALATHRTLGVPNCGCGDHGQQSLRGADRRDSRRAAPRSSSIASTRASCRTARLLRAMLPHRHARNTQQALRSRRPRRGIQRSSRTRSRTLDSRSTATATQSRSSGGESATCGSRTT